MTGEYGSAVQELVAAVNADRMEEVVRRVASAVLPGVDVHRVGWGFDDGGVPRGNLRAGVSIDKLLPTGGDCISFHLTEPLGHAPALRDLALAETRSKKRRLRLVCE